ncbi:ATP-binding cassette domain-containing protein [Paenibacillus sp. SYP-B3998]|uniref:ATP-binding cassette domain-containing protein n=1 Tax=Paenibacillus sp. SYP-B3998 TaxID=2678564 RepID=A0A6G3ZXM2_9BACL|nr:ATP-binding cassette domain-containing protein [Paenibacillus sp. SYP-B3998]NEW06321.1 ATP-binding cassette domain-containing protein [Paenibacillus sp. SYP-B3998]
MEVLILIHIEHLEKIYENVPGRVPAIQKIHLHINRGEIFGIIGHSGAGKSTLLRCVNMLERPSSGTIQIDGEEMTRLDARQLQTKRRKIGMIFQHFNLLSSATVADNIAFPLKLAGMATSVIGTRIKELLELVGLQEHAHKFPNQLSGGQKQRVGIARALANHPDILLCDEATSALDPQTTNSILSLLLDINKKLGITILLITHEMQVIRAICDRVAVMENGQIVETGNVLDVFLKPQHAVTKDFVGQVSDFGSSHEEDDSILRTSPRGKLIRITYIGAKTYEPILFQIVKSTQVSFAILQGTISSMKHVPYGQLVVELTGGDSHEIDAVITRLKQEGIDVEVITP